MFGDLPPMDAAIVAGDGQHRAVGAEGGGIHPAGSGGKGCGLPQRGQVSQHHPPRGLARREHRAVRGDGQGLAASAEREHGIGRAINPPELGGAVGRPRHCRGIGPGSQRPDAAGMAAAAGEFGAGREFPTPQQPVAGCGDQLLGGLLASACERHGVDPFRVPQPS